EDVVHEVRHRGPDEDGLKRRDLDRLAVDEAAAAPRGRGRIERGRRGHARNDDRERCRGDRRTTLHRCGASHQRCESGSGTYVPGTRPRTRVDTTENWFGENRN